MEPLNQRIRDFYAQVDPARSGAEVLTVISFAHQRGEESLNQALRSQYGKDLSFVSTPQAEPSFKDDQVPMAVAVAVDMDRSQVPKPKQKSNRKYQYCACCHCCILCLCCKCLDGDHIDG